MCLFLKKKGLFKGTKETLPNSSSEVFSFEVCIFKNLKVFRKNMVKEGERQILTHKQILQKLKRMAFEVYENNFREDEIVLAGIASKGTVVARMLGKELSNVSPLKLHYIEVSLDKEQPTQSRVKLSGDLKQLEDKPILLIDDVLNTGRTLAYSLHAFLEVRIKKLETLVIVNRGHHSFPISADYKGYELSTTISQHVECDWKDPENTAVYLY